MPTSFTIAGTDAALSIAVTGYENVEAENDWDANWLTCTVTVRVGAFTAHYAASLLTHDFARLRDDVATVRENNGGTVTFTTPEEWLAFELALRGNGEMAVSGRAQVVGPPTASLAFDFDCDRTSLGRLADELEDICIEFPVLE